MTEKRKIYVLGITELDEDEDEAIRDLGQAIALTGKQLVTAKGVSGVAQAVAWGFERAGDVPTEYISSGTVPDSSDVIIFADAKFADRVRSRVPDLDKRDWLFIDRSDIFQFHHGVLTVLSERNIHLPKYGGGRGRKPG